MVSLFDDIFIKSSNMPKLKKILVQIVLILCYTCCTTSAFHNLSRFSSRNFCKFLIIWYFRIGRILNCCSFIVVLPFQSQIIQIYYFHEKNILIFILFETLKLILAGKFKWFLPVMGAPTKKLLWGSALANLETSESLLLEDSSEYNFETCKLTEFFFHEYFFMAGKFIWSYRSWISGWCCRCWWLGRSTSWTCSRSCRT